jgi:hypothetical protein
LTFQRGAATTLTAVVAFGDYKGHGVAEVHPSGRYDDAGVIAMAKVFVLYAHESAEHREQVLAFVTFLVEQGVDVTLADWASAEPRD